MPQEAPHAAASRGERPFPFQLGPWRIDPETGRIDSGDEQASLDPKLMALLEFLASNPGQVRSRNEIEAAVWRGAIVGEDTVARSISRLRRALGDSAQTPRFIETLPKRGYRLIEPIHALAPQSREQSAQARSARAVGLGIVAGLLGVALVWFAWTPNKSAPDVFDPIEQQVERADDLYMRFTRIDNEAAIGLYERVLAERPDHADAQAGLANALVQRVVRWPRGAGENFKGAGSLQEALASGLTQGLEAEAVLARALTMAERAVRLAPKDPDALKALALTVTAQGDLDRAEGLYQQVIALDDDAWAAHVNLGEIATMRGDPVGAVGHFEQAWAAMARAYTYEPQRVGPWQVALGVVIGERYEQLGQPADAELWYRRVLAEAPFEPEATVRLARLLAQGGDAPQARSLCKALVDRIGEYPGCEVR